MSNVEVNIKNRESNEGTIWFVEEKEIKNIALHIRSEI